MYAGNSSTSDFPVKECLTATLEVSGVTKPDMVNGERRNGRNLSAEHSCLLKQYSRFTFRNVLFCQIFQQ